MSNVAMEFFRRNRTVFILGFMALMISSVGDLLAGIALLSMRGALETIVGLIILIPPAIGMRGNIFGAMGSRLGTAMHLGVFEPTLRKGSVLRHNVESSLLMTLLMSLIMGVLANIVATAMGSEPASIWVFVHISVLGGTLAGLALLVVNVVVAYLGFRRNWDVDTISAPLITAAGDVITLPMLFLAAIMVWSFPEWTIMAFAAAFIALTVAATAWTLRKGDGELRRMFRHNAPVLILCILLDLVAGVILDTRLEHFMALPVLFVLMTPFLEDANALGGILTSRFGSMLHMGYLRPGRLPSRVALENFAIIYIFALWVFTLLGVSAFAVGALLQLDGSPPIEQMVLLSLSAGLVTVTVLNFIAYYVAVATYKLSLDPDDHSIPLTSSAIDSVGALILVAFVVALGMGV